MFIFADKETAILTVMATYKTTKSLPCSTSALCVACLLGLFFVSCRPQTASIPDISSEKDSLLSILDQKEMRNIDSVDVLLLRTPKKAVAQRIILNNELGKLYREKSDFVAAVEQHRIALELAIELKDTVEIIQTYNQLGADFRRIGSLSDAAEVHYQALNMAELYSKKDTEEGKRLLSYSLNGIGNVYKSLDIRKEAFDYFKRSSQLDKELKNYLGMGMNHVTMGSILEHQGELDSALVYYTLAMQYDSLANSKMGIAICHNRIGQLLQRQQKWDEALTHYAVAKEILTERKDVWNRLKTESDMAWIFIRQKRYNEAYTLLQQLDETAKERKMYGYLEAIQYYLATLHTERGEHREANQARKLCLDYRDSIQNIRSEQNVLETRVKFEREMGERRIQDLSKANEQEQKRRKLIFYTSLIVSILLLGLLIVSYYFIRVQRRLNKRLREANNTKDKFLSILSHDLKNPIIAQRNALQHIREYLDESHEAWMLTQVDALQQSSESLLYLINSLLHWVRMQTGKMSFRPSSFDMRTSLISIIQLLKPQSDVKNITLISLVNTATIVYADKNMIEIVLRNLITNAIKFSKPGGRILVDIQSTDNATYNILVTDDGIGLTKEQITHLYTINKQQTMLGTAGEKGSGLGLIVCKELVEKNGGSLNVTSQPGVETTFSFTIKKA